MVSVYYTRQQVDWLFQNNNSWAIAFTQLLGQIDNHFPTNWLLQFAFFIFLKIIIKDSLKDAMLIFPDSFSNASVAYVIDDNWCVVKTDTAWTQIVELQTVAKDSQILANNAFYVYTDNQYVFRTL